MPHSTYTFGKLFYTEKNEQETRHMLFKPHPAKNVFNHFSYKPCPKIKNIIEEELEQ